MGIVMDKIKTYVPRILLLDTVVFLLLMRLTEEILGLFRLRFRYWVVFLILVLVFVGTIAGIAQLLLQIRKKTLLTMVFGGCCLCALVVSIAAAWMAITGFLYWGSDEHVVERDGIKYVAHVYGLQHTSVYYYEYKGFLVEGAVMRIEEYYENGGFDPMENGRESAATWTAYYDAYGNRIGTDD